MINNASQIFRNHREWIVFLVLSLLVIFLRLPSLEQPFDNDSGANAYHARLIIRGEPLYSTHHPIHHMPGVYYSYALAFLLFGDSVWAVKFLLIPWTIVTTYLLYRLGYLLMDRTTGFLAAVFYVILSSHVQLAGATAETELFANLPRLAAILALVYLVQQNAEPWKFLTVGLFCAVAFLFKAVYLIPVAITGLVFMVVLWQNRNQAGIWKTTIIRGLWVGTGMMAGIIPIVVYFGLVGVLPRFLQVFSFGGDYVNYRIAVSAYYPPEYRDYWLLFPVYGLIQNNIALVTYSLVGLLMVIFSRLKNKFLMIVCVAIWYILSIVQASLTRVLFYHYYLLIVPPLALLAAYPLAEIYHFANDKVPVIKRSLATLLFSILLAIPLWYSLSNERNVNFYQHYIRYKVGQETFANFVADGLPEEGPKLKQVQEIADYIKERTAPDDYVYYWTGNAQFYYLVDRRSPIDVIWPIYAEATGSYERIFVPQTKYIIIGRSNNVGQIPEWLPSALEKQYVLEEEIDGQKIFRRKE